MAKPTPPAISPTVASVFFEFLKQLEADGICDEETIKRLEVALDEQTLDPTSLEAALFGEEPQKS